MELAWYLKIELIRVWVREEHIQKSGFLFFVRTLSLSDRFCKELAIWGMRAWESLTLNSFKTVLCWGGKLYDFSCMTNWIICSMVLTCLFILHTIIGVITEVQSVKSKGQRVMALN